jgi:hypothetical protein
VNYTSTLSSVVRIKQVRTWCCNAVSLCLFAAAPAYVRMRKTSLYIAFCFWEALSCVLCASSLINSVVDKHHL